MSISLEELAKLIEKIEIKKESHPSLRLYISRRKQNQLSRGRKLKEKEHWISVSFTKDSSKRSRLPADAEIIYERFTDHNYNVLKFFKDNKTYLKHIHGQNFRMSDKKLDMFISVLRTEDRLSNSMSSSSSYGI